MSAEQPREAVRQVWSTWTLKCGRSFNFLDICVPTCDDVGEFANQLVADAIQFLSTSIGPIRISWNDASAGALFRDIFPSLIAIRDRTERPEDERPPVDSVETEWEYKRGTYDEFPQTFANILLKRAILKTLLDVETLPSELISILNRPFRDTLNLKIARPRWYAIADEFVPLVKKDFRIEW